MSDAKDAAQAFRFTRDQKKVLKTCSDEALEELSSAVRVLAIYQTLMVFAAVGVVTFLGQAFSILQREAPLELSKAFLSLGIGAGGGLGFVPIINGLNKANMRVRQAKRVVKRIKTDIGNVFDSLAARDEAYHTMKELHEKLIYP